MNKLFSWLLSEAHKCHKSSAARDTIKLTIYLTALLSALQMAIDRKQEVQGLERLLNEICLPLLLSAVPSSGDHPFSISLRITEYLCNHTDAVWSVCADFAIIQLNQFQTIIPNDAVSDEVDAQKLKISAFKQLCEFMLMLLDCTKSMKAMDSNQNQQILRWIQKVHSLCCHSRFLWEIPYLKLLTQTIWFHLFAKETTFPMITDQTRILMTDQLLESIAERQCKMQMEHFVILQWIANIRFIASDHNTNHLVASDHRTNESVALRFRQCIMLGLSSGMKVNEKICIQILRQYHSHILYPGNVSSECISSVVVLWNAMYEERAKTISNMLSLQIPKILESLSASTLKSKSEFKPNQRMKSGDSTTSNPIHLHPFDAVQWIQSILHLVWTKGLEHQNKAIRRCTLYCLLSWDFTPKCPNSKHQRALAPFQQSFIMNEFLILMNRPLFFRRSHYDISRQKGRLQQSGRSTVSWQNTSGKCEEALSTRSPPEGFGYLLESFLTNYVVHFVGDIAEKRAFVSDFVMAVCSKITKFYALFHFFNFLGNLPGNIWMVMTTEIMQSLHSLMTNVMAKFGPLYRSKITPIICRVISQHIPVGKVESKEFDFYALCKLVAALPRHCIAANRKHEGFLTLRAQWNRSDWIGQQILKMVTQCRRSESMLKSVNVSWIGLMFEFMDCTTSYLAVMEVLFESISRAYSAPYQSQMTVAFCMELLCYNVALTENHPVLFGQHRKVLRAQMMEKQVMNEVMSYILDRRLETADFTDIRSEHNWILRMTLYLIRFYGDHPTVHSVLESKVHSITTQMMSNEQYVNAEALPTLFVWSHCMRHRSMMKDDGNMERMLLRFISMRIHPNLRKQYAETLQILQFCGIRGLLSAPKLSVRTETARKVIQFGVDCLDLVQYDNCADLLESLSLLLPFAKLSLSNLQVLSDAAWHILASSSTTTTRSVVPQCIDLLLFPMFFSDTQMHCHSESDRPMGHIRSQIVKALESKKSTVLEPVISHSFILWFESPEIATLYVDEVVAMCHSVYHEKVFDPEDRVHRDEYLFASLLLFLSVMFQQREDRYQPFKSTFIERLFVMIERECEVPHLDVVHQRTWNVFWHISQFITVERGFDDEEIGKMMRFLCDLCYSDGRSVSSNQRQWITLSIVRMVSASPKYVDSLFTEYHAVGRRPNSLVWLMYAVGRSAIVIAENSSVEMEFKISTLRRIIHILAPCLCSNFGLVRTTAQYFLFETVRALKEIVGGDGECGLDEIVERMYCDLLEIPDAIKLRKRLKATFAWLERGELATTTTTKKGREIEETEDGKAEEKMEETEDETMHHQQQQGGGGTNVNGVLAEQLKASGQRAITEMESLRNDIVSGILEQHPLLDGNVVIKEILWLVQDRESLVGVTEQITSALSDVMLEHFDWYNVVNAKKYGDDVENGNGGGNMDSTGYQRKLDTMLLEYGDLMEAEQLALDRQLKAERRKVFGDVIVVTSLLEKATNLGGISRTAEIFGVKQMVVHDKRVVKRDDFKNLSVTSQDWLPIEAVPRTELLGYLRTMRTEEKYCIVGLEQTTSSVMLHQFDFAKLMPSSKCVIVVGRERTGLPPDILNQCDFCVEIPQFGILRSLNAHVSFAITLWEYFRQHLVVAAAHC